MTLKINGEVVKGQKVAFDGCHKFYLVRNDSDLESMRDSGWTDEKDYYPLNQLPTLWNLACALKFMHSGDLSETFVSQDDSHEATVEWVES